MGIREDFERAKSFLREDIKTACLQPPKGMAMAKKLAFHAHRFMGQPKDEFGQIPDYIEGKLDE